MIVPMIVAGILGPIEEILEALLRWLHGSVGIPWAWAIVALTMLVRIALVPLTVRQIHSMQRLQAHMPEMKAIQQRHKGGDRQKMNQEMMAFYKENKINPASSCLPILAQIPIFISLFYVLKDFDKEVLPDFPTSDLSWLNVVPDITAAANSHWSGYLLLVIYAASQTLSTLLMSTTMERTQRMIMLVLPLAFLFIVLNFPAGLVLYWVTTNLWTMGQGLVTRRLAPKPPEPQKRSSRTPPRAAAPAEDGAKPADEVKAPPPRPKQVRKVKRKKGRARR
jgi:YidC/Oxa1 family membrane protein insertase